MTKNKHENKMDFFMKTSNNTIIIIFFLIILSACGGGSSGNNETDKNRQAKDAISRAGDIYSSFNYNTKNTSRKTKRLQKKSRETIPEESFCSLGGKVLTEIEATEETYATIVIKDTFTACKYNTQSEKDLWSKDANFLEGTTFFRFIKGINTNNNLKGLMLTKLEEETNLSVFYNKKFTKKTVNLDDVFSDSKNDLFSINIEFDTPVNKLYFKGGTYLKIDQIDDFNEIATIAINHKNYESYRVIANDNSGIEIKNMDTSVTLHYVQDKNLERFKSENLLYSDTVININETILSENNPIKYELKTIMPFRYYPLNENPSTGEMTIYNSQDKSLVKIFVLDSNNIKVSVDLENNGNIDYTERMKWSEF